MAKTHPNFYIDEKVYKAFKKKCIEEGKTYSQVVESLIKVWIGK